VANKEALYGERRCVHFFFDWLKTKMPGGDKPRTERVVHLRIRDHQDKRE
jgi:hypothetical protein